ncbi:MAG TPA: hypothetical protein VFD92_04945 [Candidatus Binatia bacterium]|nr:hypothetical protein [Candidatus Binatia bacterium]
MKDSQNAVKQFHQAFDLTIGDTPMIREPELRATLIDEEANETTYAIMHGDLVGAIDGMCDLIYVVLGTAVAFGIDLEPFFWEIHRSNMSKVGGTKNALGKLVKPPTYSPPRIAQLLKSARGSSR